MSSHAGVEQGFARSRPAWLVEPSHFEHECPSCGAVCGFGPDPCLGTLPDVISACCGHPGDPSGLFEPYVVRTDGRWYSGDAALELMRELGGQPQC